MVSFTPFLGLRKTAATELMDVRRDIAYNIEKIDETVGKLFDEPWLDFGGPFTNVGVNVLRSKYKRMGTLLLYQVNGRVTSVPTGTIVVNLPPGNAFQAAGMNLLTSGTRAVTVTGSGTVVGTANRGGRLLIYNPWSAHIYGPGLWNATVPFTWTVGSQISFSLMAEMES